MESCPRCSSEDVRRVTETDLSCIFCGHEWLDPTPPDEAEPNGNDDPQSEQPACDAKKR